MISSKEKNMNLKKLITPALFSMLCIGGANASLVDMYVGATGGIGSQRYIVDGVMSPIGNFNKSATSYGALIGLDVPVVRVEAEYNKLDTKALKTNLAMANVIFKLLPTPVVTPYLGIGAGMQFNGSMETVDSDNNWAAQGMLGLTFSIPATSMKIDAEARAVYMPDVFEDCLNIIHYEGRIKIRYQF
jgi:hypothetical protein